MEITYARMESEPALFAFSISFSRTYGMIGIDFGSRSIVITLYNTVAR